MKTTQLDLLGAAASFLCAIHCATMPLIIGLLPLAGLSFLAGESAEWLFTLCSLTIGFFSFWPSYLHKHKKLLPLSLLLVGACFLVAARLWFEDAPFLEISFAVLGALLLISAHLINRHFSHQSQLPQTSKFSD